MWMMGMLACQSTGSLPQETVDTADVVRPPALAIRTPFLLAGPYATQIVPARLRFEETDLLLSFAADAGAFAGRVPLTAPENAEYVEVGTSDGSAPVTGQAQGRLVVAWATGNGRLMVRGQLGSGELLDPLAVTDAGEGFNVGMGLAPDGAGSVAHSRGGWVDVYEFDRETTAATPHPTRLQMGDLPAAVASASLGDGRLWTVWRGPSLSTDEELFALRAATMPGDGEDEVAVDDTTSRYTSNEPPAVAAADGLRAVAWEAADGIWFRAFDDAGPVAAPVQVAPFGSEAPALAFLGDHVALVYEALLDDAVQVHLAILRTDGTPVYDAMVPHHTPLVDFTSPTVAARPVNQGHELVIAWTMADLGELWAQTVFVPAEAR